MDSIDPELELDYPREWEFRIIGLDEARLRAAAADVVGETPHNLQAGNQSSGGKYVSMQLSLQVASEEERNATFGRLSAHADIVYVL